MKKLTLLALILTVFLVGFLFTMAGSSYCWEDNNDVFGNDYGLLSPMKHNAYGPGIHSDATGRPFKFETFDGKDVQIFKAKPNAYGPGIGMDEFGRPVRAKPLDRGW